MDFQISQMSYEIFVNVMSCRLLPSQLCIPTSIFLLTDKFEIGTLNSKNLKVTKIRQIDIIQVKNQNMKLFKIIKVPTKVLRSP